MLHYKGDIWDMLERDYRVVVTTNIGWSKDGHRNNMGAGTAREAMQRWPHLPRWYGERCKAYGAKTAVLAHAPPVPLLFFPVKPLLTEDPEYSWNQQASLDLIRRSTAQLAKFRGKIALTLPGCGNGQLDPEEVYPILARHLSSDRFALVDNRNDWQPPGGWTRLV